MSDVKHSAQELGVLNLRHPAQRGQITPKEDQHFMCGECGKGYKWMHNLRRHQRLECGQAPTYFCNMCEKTFYRQYDMYEEYVPTVVFDDSNQQESQQWEMISSESYIPLPTSYKNKEPTSERPFQCPNCNRTYKLLDSLRRHLRAECGGKQKQFQCYFCKKDFRYRYEMSKHITTSH
ncbi:zinc finger E-box-binding homeobox 2-like [Belonocnema kinseyi]|uniref:zinc finger E-box-binding homeobox 2-like n=1 Tax=Belonocnema kinseyi TaxID=2817044 RepID=UPI00143CC3C3|nr:zinc finger E-box-binding homeobox 2-like [Belonocnema kinseyi]